jgi:hypothetical protein
VQQEQQAQCQDQQVLLVLSEQQELLVLLEQQVQLALLV